MRDSLKRAVFWSLLVTIPLLPAVLASEAMVRLLYPDLVRQPRLSFGDDLMRYRNRPHMNMMWQWSNVPFHVTTNAQGLRETRETPYKTEDNRMRVMFLGDSFVFGLGVNDGEDVVRRTEQILKSTFGNSVECLNMGIPGSGPSIQYLHYIHEGVKYNPKIVVIQVYGNDIADDARDNVFTVSDGELREIPFKSAPFSKITHSSVYSWLSTHSSLFTLVRTALQTSPEREKRVASALSKESVDSYGRVSSRVWMEIVDEIRKNHAIPIFLLVEKGSDDVTKKAYLLAEEVAGRKGVLTVSAIDAIERNFKNNVSAAYIALEDNHWSARGNAVVAAHLSTYLIPIIKRLQQRP